MVAQVPRSASGPFVPYRIPQTGDTGLMAAGISFKMSSSWGGLFGRPAILWIRGASYFSALISSLLGTLAAIHFREVCIDRKENYLAMCSIATIVSVLLEAILR